MSVVANTASTSSPHGAAVPRAPWQSPLGHMVGRSIRGDLIGDRSIGPRLDWAGEVAMWLTV